jgi:hypothetical protein
MLLLSHKFCGFQGHVGGRIVMMKEQRGVRSDFLLKSPGKLQLIRTVSASSWIVWQWSSLMSSQIFSTFSVVLLVLGCSER